MERTATKTKTLSLHLYTRKASRTYTLNTRRPNLLYPSIKTLILQPQVDNQEAYSSKLIEMTYRMRVC